MSRTDTRADGDNARFDDPACAQNATDTHASPEFECVVLSEADFGDPAKREAAIARLVDGAPKRTLVRPHISAVKATLNVLLPLIVCAALFCALYFGLNENRLAISLGVSLGSLGLYILLRLRDIMIWCILVYQRFAPEQTRLRCVFTPSCSEYAILALKKYGVLRGVPKIISRLKRCHPPNEGDDPLV